jgi:hypothetical protein
MTIESTSRIVNVDGVEGRVWQGQTDSGIPVVCIIHRVATHESHSQVEFERELQRCAAPNRVATMAFPARMVTA